MQIALNKLICLVKIISQQCCKTRSWSKNLLSKKQVHIDFMMGLPGQIANTIVENYYSGLEKRVG